MLREVCETDLVANDVAIMTLSFAAQSLVVVIVGVYMGFRYADQDRNLGDE